MDGWVDRRIYRWADWQIYRLADRRIGDGYTVLVT